LVNDLTEEFLELAVGGEIQLTSQVPSQAIHVLGNESELYRVVSNLIANAIHYTRAGGSVRVSLEQIDRCAVIAVKDTGIGIPTDQQNRIFDRFYRVDSDRSRKTGGTGLGLAIAQTIALKHQGRIKVESKVDQGSLFRVELGSLWISSEMRSVGGMLGVSKQKWLG